MESRTDDPKSLSTKRSKEQLMLKNRPKDSRWRQQDHSIAICRPIYTAGVVISLVFLVGCVFIPLGIWCLLTSDSVKEVKLEYTNCSRIGSSCELNVKLETDFSGNVYFYYGLTNYFQNARRYLRSWNPEQLTGNLEITTRCSDPYKTAPVNLPESECGKRDDGSYVRDGRCVIPIAPCGAVANSMFTDVFELRDSNGQVVPWTYEGLLWDKEKERFKNPEQKPGESLCDVFKRRSRKPLAWKKSPCELDPNNPGNNGFLNFDFIVWMNSAAFSTFRKPYRRLRREGQYVDGMPKGLYKLKIQNDYNVHPFKGKKYFILTTTSWFGGKNRFFGLSFLIVGSFCLFFGVTLLIVYYKNGHTLQEVAEMSQYTGDKHD